MAQVDETGKKIEQAVGTKGLQEMQAALLLLSNAKGVPNGAWNNANTQGVDQFIKEQNAWRKPPLSPVDWNNPESINNFRTVLLDAVKSRSGYDSDQIFKAKKDVSRPAPGSTEEVRQIQLYLNILNFSGKTPTGQWSDRDNAAIMSYGDSKGSWHVIDGPQNAAYRSMLIDNLKQDVETKTGMKAEDLRALMNPIIDQGAGPQKQPEPAKSEPRRHRQSGVDAITDDKVAAMQAQLTVLGQYKGPINGVSGSNDPDPESVQKKWDEYAKTHAQEIHDTVDKAATIRDNPKRNQDVVDMQNVLLAMGGKLHTWGADGLNWNETRGALDDVAGPQGQLRKLMNDNNLDASWLHNSPDDAPVAAPSSTATAPQSSTPTAEPVPVPNAAELMGEGGFIMSPSRRAAQAAQAAQPARSANDEIPEGDPDRTPPQRAPDQPAVRQPPPPVSAGDAMRRGTDTGLTANYNYNSRMDLGQASQFFQRISTDYIHELGENRGFDLKILDRARMHGNQGEAFLRGPDGKFAALYAYNAGQMTYMKSYDLTNDKGLRDFNHDKLEAERKQEEEVQKYGTHPQQAPQAGGPYYPPSGGTPPIMGRPGGVNVDVDVNVGRGSHFPIGGIFRRW